MGKRVIFWWFFSMLGLSMVLLACFMLSTTLRVYSDGRRADSWVMTKGVIEHSTLLEGSSGGSTGNRGKRGRTTRPPSPSELLVTYRYEVDGLQLRGTRIAMGSSPPEEELSRTYSIGAVVPVYYDPALPTESCLIRGTALPAGFIGGGMLALFACGTFFFILWRWKNSV